jgi:preprotein translocase subunit SecD
MIFFGRQFNLYLLSLLVLTLACGCQTNRKSKQVSTVRLYIECAPNMTAGGKPVSVLRDEPVTITVNTAPFLSEANVISATLLDATGGCGVKIQFDGTGSWMLEQYTSSNPGRHLVINGQWGKKPVIERWLAAPLITERIANGQLSFTPDATHEEMQEWVQGLNNVAKKNAKEH